MPETSDHPLCTNQPINHPNEAIGTHASSKLGLEVEANAKRPLDERSLEFKWRDVRDSNSRPPT